MSASKKVLMTEKVKWTTVSDHIVKSGEYVSTFESQRRVLGGYGDLPDYVGIGSYIAETGKISWEVLNFLLLDDIRVLTDPTSTPGEMLKSGINFVFKPVKVVDDVVEIVVKAGNKAEDVPTKVPEPKTESTGSTIGNGKDTPVVDKYEILKNDKTIPGQAHHLNQDAAYREAIPTNQGLSTKLEGNAFKDVNSPHYNAHENLEQFWNQYRRDGAKFGSRPSNLEYTKAMVDSLKSAGYSQEQAMQIANEAIKQRVQYGLLGGEPVPRIPGKINQSKR